MKSIRSLSLGIIAITTGLLAACGGGGDSSTPTLTPTPIPPLVLQASAGDLSKYTNTIFRSGCGSGFIGTTPYSGYATFNFGTATTAFVSGFYNFSPAGLFACSGGSSVPPQAINFTMTYLGTTTVASSNASASGVADVFSFRNNATNLVSVQTFAFNSAYSKLYVSNANASFTSSSLSHDR